MKARVCALWPNVISPKRYRVLLTGTDEDVIMTVVTDLSDPKSLIPGTVMSGVQTDTSVRVHAHTHSREDTAVCVYMFHEIQKFKRKCFIF